MPKPEIVAHRGGAGLWPENSLTAFREVRSLGVDQIEMDVHLTADGELAVIHDPLLDRTTNGQGAVAAKTRAELTAISPTGLSEGVVVLDEVLELLAPTGLPLQIEIKTDQHGIRYPGIEEKAIAAVRKLGLLDRVIFGSFQPETVARVRELAPETTRCGFVGSKAAQKAGGLVPAIGIMADAGADYIGLQHTIADADALKAVRSLGLSLGVWTVNDRADLDRWVRQPVDFVTTDRPDLALAAREGRA
jgi:glycerophosphoryl diester phosphodiesterase